MSKQLPKFTDTFALGEEVNYEQAYNNVFIPFDEAMESAPSITAVSTINIVGNTITPTSFLHKIMYVNEVSSTNKELHLIDYTNMRDGGLLRIRLDNNATAITIKNNKGGNGSILTQDGNDIILDDERTIIEFQREGLFWRQVGGVQKQSDLNQTDVTKPDFVKGQDKFYTKEEVYNKEEVYTKEEVYNKNEVDTQIKEATPKTVFSINEASKDTSGNPNFMSVLGEQITFNGAVKYTQANGESVEKASVSSINIPLKYEPEGVVNPIVQANISEAATVTNTGTIYAGNDRAYKCFDGTRTLDNDLVAWSTSSGSVKEEFAKPVYGRNFKVSILTHYYTDPSRTLGNVVITIYYDDNTTQDISMGTLSGNQVHETELFNTEKGIKAIELTHSGSVMNITTLDIVYFDLVGEQLKREDGYVMLNNGVASVVPVLEVQQSEPAAVWEQPVLSNNGTIGVGDFATFGSSVQEQRESFRIFDGTQSQLSTEVWHSSASQQLPQYVGWWSREQINLSGTISVWNMDYSPQPASIKKAFLEVSNNSTDGSDGDWIAVAEINNSTNTNAGKWSFEVPLYSGFYHFNRIKVVEGWTNYVAIAKIFVKGATKKIEPETVWFNSYNNQAKQYNGTDWVDYNGVPVGPVTDGVAYNYQYNTWKGVSPVFDSASPETNGVVVRLGMPDYTRSEDFIKDQEYKIEKDGVIEITATCTHTTQESLIINSTSFIYASSYTNSSSTGSLYKVVYKGDTVLAQGSGSIRNYKFTPFKGAL